MIHLSEVHIGKPKGSTQTDRFPYTVPTLRAFTGMTFRSDVTFFVGENGSGKSTLIEALACAVDSITVGSAPVNSDPTLADVRGWASAFKLTWTGARHRKGFFMRAEDFFGYARSLEAIRAEMRQEIEEVDRTYKNRSDTARGLAKLAYNNELGDLRRRYGDGLDAVSHGESFFKLFGNRFVAGGLYLLDEPEAPLSPLRQLSFLTMIKDMVTQKAQFIIATHSPILMAYPGATILSFADGAIQPIAYDDTEHVSITRSFLQNPQQYLKHLLA